MRVLRPRTRGEDGSVTPMILGFLAILLLLTAVVIDASAVYLRRAQLDGIADAAALAGIAAVQQDALYASDAGALALDPAAAARAVDAAVADAMADPAHAQTLRDVSVVTTVEACFVRVDLRARTRLPWRVPGVDLVVPLRSRAAALVAVDGGGCR